MRTKKVLRHYCDHCNKGGFGKPQMAAHELTCIYNPKRACYLCEGAACATDQVSERVAAVEVKIERGETSQQIVDFVMAETHCPACALAVLVQYRKKNKGKLYRNDPEDDEPMWFGEFDYKRLKTEWYSEQYDCSVRGNC